MKIKIILTAVLTLLITSCAHRSAPGGGPEDKTPAQIAASYPESGQTNVSKDISIDITFSKWVNLSSAKGAVTIYPPIPNGFDVKAARNRVKIIPNSPLKDSTTYHVIVGTTLQDLRGNAVERPIKLVFSTGSVLDSAQLSGSVISLAPFVTLPKVALYKEYENWSDTTYFSVPDYMIQSDSGGAFQFINLREGKYRAVAFHGQGRAERMRVGDQCYTPIEKNIDVSKAGSFIRLYPSESDTLPPRINSIKAVDSVTLRGSWNKKYDFDRFSQAQYYITAVSESENANTIRTKTSMFANGTDFFVTLNKPLKNAVYKFFYSYSDISDPRRLMSTAHSFSDSHWSMSDSLRFNGTTVPDTIRPELKGHSPSGSASLTPELRLIWSEPVSISQSKIIAVAADSAGVDSAVFFSTNKYSDTTLLTVKNKLKPGRQYKLSIPLQMIKDISGNTAVSNVRDSVDGKVKSSVQNNVQDSISVNVLDNVKESAFVNDEDSVKHSLQINTQDSIKDSIIADIAGDSKDSIANSIKDNAQSYAQADIKDSSVTIYLTTISADSICYRLHGGAACLNTQEKRKWVYRPRGRDETYITDDKAGTFSFDSIPASKGKLFWFIDDNNDNLLTPGRITPWKAPERFVSVPDSLEARARWEIEDLQVKACEDNE